MPLFPLLTKSSVRHLRQLFIVARFTLLVIGILGTNCFLDGAAGRVRAAEIDFARQVQPILAKRCYACHGPDESEAGLGFHTKETSFGETDSGDPAIVAGDPSASQMLVRITSEDEAERMPPEGDPVTESEIEILRQWIQEGAEFTKHWAFEPVGDYEPPAVASESGADVHPIDAFVLDSLSEAGLKQNPLTDRRTLIRRATFDLTGLPPTTEEVEAFVADTDPNAYEHLIDRLLESHHYGEKWGRHWLDLVHFAETNSFERDNPKPNAWKYRDYVIRSFNEDKPYNQFVREQLAGDVLDEVNEESLTATGYYRLGIWDDEPADPLQAKFDELDDLITTTGQVFLGLTINCARCHDHKIDPIPQTDYYGMLAFFADVTRYGERGDQVSFNQFDVSSDELNQKYAECDAEEKRVAELRREIEQAGIVKMSAPDQRATEGNKRDRTRVLKEKLKDNVSKSQWAVYQSLGVELRDVKKQRDQLPQRQQILALAKRGPVEETFVMFRGNPHSPTDKVRPHFPNLYDQKAPEVTDDNRRRVLADWIVDPNNRLTTRVIANRVWQHHFGRGIVRSTNNFGQLGTPPTHPKLLDFLANQVAKLDWKLKPLHKLVMTSQAYQMSSDSSAEGLASDPGNDLFWRFDPRRLGAEEVRDTVLAVNGTLNRQPYGPSFYPTLSAEVLAGQSRPGSGWGKSNSDEQNRRSIYIHVKRSLLTPMLSAFDFPDPDTTCEARFVTLQPGQAMSLLNSDFIHEEAATLAESARAALARNSLARNSLARDSLARDSLAREKLDGDTSPEFVAKVIQTALARPATKEEIREGEQLLRELTADYKVPLQRAQTLFALSVLNWNEFVFVF